MMTRIIRRLAVAWLCAAIVPFVWGQAAERSGNSAVPEFTFKIVHTYPHDANAFTQGLVYQDGFLYEGTGLNGQSTLRKVRLENGEVLQKTDLTANYFGEGVAILPHQNDQNQRGQNPGSQKQSAESEIAQLTWQSHLGFIYRLSDFHLLRSFSYAGEGWGLASDGRDVYMSDGTAEIRVLDSETMAEKRRFTVRDGKTKIAELNELECVEGELLANVWQTDRIARISTKTGEVVGWIDLRGLLSPVYRLAPGAVLNGIAYDAAHKRLFVTGKLWPSLFEIQLVPKRAGKR